MDRSIEKLNRAVKYLGATTKGKERFVYSKLGNELTLITTKLCNLNCAFCYDKANVSNPASMANIKYELSNEQIIKLINISKRLGVTSIRLTGGEALLKQGFYDILNACEGIYVSLCSNGLILKKNLPKIIKSHPKDLHIHLSLEGIECHKKYRVGSDPYKLIALAKYIKEKYPQVMVSINTVASQDNIYELVQTYNLLKNIPIDRWTISFPRLVANALAKNFKVPNVKEFITESDKLVKLHNSLNSPFGLTISYFQKYELTQTSKYKAPEIQLNQHPCLPDANGARGLIVDSFGNILDCLTLKPFLKHPVSLFDFLSEKDPSPDEFIKLIERSLESRFYDIKLKDRKECLSCRYLKLCKGGCPANAYYLFGDLNEVDILSCLMFYNFEKYLLPRLTRKYREMYSQFIDSTKKVTSIKNRIKINENVLIQIGCLH